MNQDLDQLAKKLRDLVRYHISGLDQQCQQYGWVGFALEVQRMIDAARMYPGSFARMINVILGRILAGVPRSQVLADYRWEHDEPPDLSALDDMLAAARVTSEEQAALNDLLSYQENRNSNTLEILMRSAVALRASRQPRPRYRVQERWCAFVETESGNYISHCKFKSDAERV